MGLFPPWVLVEKGTKAFMGYYFFLYQTMAYKKLPATSKAPYLSIDIARLSVQWIIVVVVTGGLILTFHSSEKSRLRLSANKDRNIEIVGRMARTFLYILCLVFGLTITVVILYYAPWKSNSAKWEIVLKCVIPGLAGFYIPYFLIHFMLDRINRRYADLYHKDEKQD